MTSRTYRPTPARLQSLCHALRQLGRLDVLTLWAVDHITRKALRRAKARARRRAQR